MTFSTRPRIGMLWGDFPWSSPPEKLWKLWSVGRVARNLTRALNMFGEVIPFQRPLSGAANALGHRASLVAFLQNIDLLYADLAPPSARILALRDELGLDCPALIHTAGLLPTGAQAMLFPGRRFLRSNDGLLFSSSADHALWKRLVQWSHLHEWIIPLSVDETMFYPRSKDEQLTARRQHDLPLDVPLLLYVGRLNIQKNLHTVLDLLAAVREQVPDVHLGIVGEEDVGEGDDIVLREFGVRNTGYLTWLQARARERGVAACTTFLGAVTGEDLVRLYAAANVVVNLGVYHRENFGLAQAEAAACGVPVVCTAWGGFKDIVQHGETGYVVDAILTKHGIRVDWMQAVHAVVTLLQHPTLCAQMGQRASRYAREHFSVASLARHFAQTVAEMQQAPQTKQSVFRLPAYQPSSLAEQYEAHKRACGWYASEQELRENWYPTMFQGQDYALYEQLMQPYATQLAQDLACKAIQAEWVPYFPSPVALDPLRWLACDNDPIWPHQRFCRAADWEILWQVDGHRTIQEITQAAGTDLEECRAILWLLYIDGFVLFAKPALSLR